MEVEDIIQIEETGPDFVLQSLEKLLIGTKFCDLAFVCAEKCVVLAHCSVVAAVSEYIRDIMAEVFNPNEKEVPIYLPDFSFADVQSFLELVYTGSVTLSEKRRQPFTSLLELFVVNDQIGECVSFLDSDNEAGEDLLNNGREEVGGGGVTIERVEKKTVTARVSAAAKNVGKRPIKPSVSVNISPVKTDSLPALNRLQPVLEPPNKKLKTGPWNHNGTAPSDLPPLKFSDKPPPSETLLAHLEMENKKTKLKDANFSPVIDKSVRVDGRMLASVAAADLATKDWLDSSNTGVPQVVDAGNGEISLSPVSSCYPRKCERCRCPLCMDPNRIQVPGEPTMHLCHYPNCGKMYKKTSHLRAHLRWHIGDQPYLCSWPGCSRKFTRSDELHRHFRIHTGEKKHKCLICGKLFSRSDHLKKHKLSHHQQLFGIAGSDSEVLGIGGPQESLSNQEDMSGDDSLGAFGLESELDPTQLLEMGSYQDEDGGLFNSI